MDRTVLGYTTIDNLLNGILEPLVLIPTPVIPKLERFQRLFQNLQFDPLPQWSSLIGQTFSESVNCLPIFMDDWVFNAIVPVGIATLICVVLGT